MFLEQGVGNSTHSSIQLDSHVVEITRQAWRSEPVILSNGSQLYNLDFIVIVLWDNLDDSTTTLTTLLAVILILLGSADHEAIIMLENTRVIELDRYDEVHLSDGDGYCRLE